MKTLRSTASTAALLASLVAAAGAAQAQDGGSIADEIEDQIVVRGVFVPDEKQDTAEISSVLDADDFARAGDSDVAAAIRRVAGLSVVDGKFPVARGLNERYQSATVNGVPLPSPEPLRRAVPLDIIPTRILSGSLAQKTYSPEYSAEFGGAAIDLRTSAVPTESFIQVGGTIGFDTVTTGEDGFFTDGSDTDNFGYDDGLRDLPSIVNDEVLAGRNNLSPEAGAAFDNSDTLLIVGDDVPVNGGGSVVTGLVLADTPDLRIGNVTFVGFNRTFVNREGVQDRTRLQSGTFNTDSELVRLDFLETRENTEFNAFTSTGFEFGGDHEVKATAFLLRSTLDRARIGTGFDQAERGENEIQEEFVEFIERQVWQTQLAGEHVFPGLGDFEASWRVAYGEADRDSPYERTTVRSRENDGDQFLWTQANGGNTIEFSELSDQNFYAGADGVLPYDLGGLVGELKFGGAYTDNSRDTQIRSFRIVQGNALDGQGLGELATLRTDLLYADEIFENDILRAVSETNRLFPDTTEASLEVNAAYVMTDLELTEYLRVSVGGRYEDSTQETSTFQSAEGSPSADQTVTLEEDYFLPAATITWNPAGNWQLRAGASQTITRPQFRELAGTEFLDPDLDVPLQGNPFLQNSEITNFDLRAEWYFSRNEFATLGFFYKDIENPIERALTTRESLVSTFVNSDSAEVWGFEGEFEKRFELVDTGINWLQDQELVFVANYTYSESEVTVGDEIIFPGLSNGVVVPDTSGGLRPVDGHSLQGQSDHLANLQIGFEDVNNGDRLTALLNYASDRTLLIGTELQGDTDAVIEDVPLLLDIVYQKNFDFMGGQYTFGAKVQNVLGEEFNAFREDNAGTELSFTQFDRGQVFTLSLTAEF